MRNLLRFILNNHFVILFILFETVALIFLFQNNNYQKAFAFNISRNISGKINSRIFSLRQYLNLNEANKALFLENARLRNNLLSSYKLAVPAARAVEFDSAWTLQYYYIPARVISNSVNKQNNYLSLDKGSVHGVKTDMGVVSHDGLVGIVTGVSENFSTVISLLNTDLRISSRLKDTGYFGSLHWNGHDPETASLYDIPHHVSLNYGDTIVTSGYSAIFPRGIMIGTIADFEIIGGNFYNISVNLSTDFRKLDYTYIIEDFLRDELIELETGTIYD